MQMQMQATAKCYYRTNIQGKLWLFVVPYKNKLIELPPFYFLFDGKLEEIIIQKPYNLCPL